MNFLTEHQIEQYADLISRIEEINSENEKTADALKSVEKLPLGLGLQNLSRFLLR